jgi:hypothetical protein
MTAVETTRTSWLLTKTLSLFKNMIDSNIVHRFCDGLEE